MSLGIIVLGTDCAITFGLINHNLKGPSGLFEWCAHGEFQGINTVLKSFINTNTIELTERENYGGNLFLGSTDIHTAHYTKDTYPEILQRRWARFQEYLKSNFVLFIRYDLGAPTKKEELCEFKKLIESINPAAKYKILLLYKEGTYSKIEEENVYQNIFSEKFLHEIIQTVISPMKLPMFSSDKNDKD